MTSPTKETKKNQEGASSTTSYYYHGTNQAAQHFLLETLAGRFLERATAKAQKPLKDFQESLPKDPENVRQIPFYKATLDAIKNQRDMYLVGEEYAQNRVQTKSNDASGRNKRLPFDATALGNLQIVQLGSWFIPSPTVKSALMPIVLPLPTGALYMPAVQGIIYSLPYAQPSLNAVVKSSMLSFMDDPYWREVIKNTTRGYVVVSSEES